jgi:glycolate oxidase iron-sulfur subunit
VDAVVTDVAGCGSVLKESAMPWRAYDVTEFLVSLGDPLARRHPLPLTVAYHDACHLAHGQGVRSQPRALLSGIPSLRLVEPADVDMCCGSAGVYNLLQPSTAEELGARKAAALLDTGADVVAAGNPGCALQIAASLRAAGHERPRVVHTVELLDASLRGDTAEFVAARRSPSSQPMYSPTAHLVSEHGSSRDSGLPRPQ